MISFSVRGVVLLVVRFFDVDERLELELLVELPRFERLVLVLLRLEDVVASLESALTLVLVVLWPTANAPKATLAQARWVR